MKKIFTSFLIAAALIASCKGDEEVQPGGCKSSQFSMSLDTFMLIETGARYDINVVNTGNNDYNTSAGDNHINIKTTITMTDGSKHTGYNSIGQNLGAGISETVEARVDFPSGLTIHSAEHRMVCD